MGGHKQGMCWQLLQTPSCTRVCDKNIASTVIDTAIFAPLPAAVCVVGVGPQCKAYDGCGRHGLPFCTRHILMQLLLVHAARVVHQAHSDAVVAGTCS